MPSSTHDLIPASISSFLSLTTTGDNSNNNNHDLSVGTVDPSPTELRAQLNKIPRKSWLKLGAECHNSGFAAEIALTVVSKPTASSSMSISAMAAAKAAAAAGPALNLANGLPKIVETIHRRRQQHMSKVAAPSSSSSSLSSDTQQPRALLWDMYFFYQDHCNSSININNNHNSHARAGRAAKSKSASSSFSSTPPAAWQLQFLKSACPEVIVLAFADAFLEHGPKRGFVDRDVPTDLIQVLDYEWRSDSAPARRAVLALVQTMIACRRHVKAINNNTVDPASSGTKPSRGVTGLGAKQEVPGSVVVAGIPQEDGDQQQQKAAFENGCYQLAKILADACSSLEIFFTTETGRTLPKLQSLLQQELAADIKAHSKIGTAGLERGIKRPAASSSSLGVMGGRDMGAAGPDALDPVTKKRLKETSSGSPSLLSRQGSNDSGSVKSSPALSSSSSSLSKGIRNDALEDRALMGTLLSTKHILERAQTGQLAANNAAQQQQQPLLPLQQTAVVSSSLSSLGQQQQAKLSNPLWSPILGLNYLPQSPQKYMVQVEAELARWISLLGHMDGVVFNDKLTSLIRAVYPSDQKFLLDLLLIEYMSWEGTEGQELLDVDGVAAPAFLEDAFHRHQVNSNKSTAGPDGNNNNKGSTLKSGEWILEVILGAFVGLVMKPEDSNTHLEPGSKKWSESIEILEDEDEDEVDGGGAEVVGGGSGEVSKKATTTTTITTASATAATGMKSSNSTATSVDTGTSSATTPARPSVAMGGGSAMMAKKRRMRTLYNRRVSPFYATLLMFQPKRVVGRVQGVLYLSHEELDSSQPEVSSNPGAGGVAGKDAEALLKQATETAHQLKTSLAVDKTESSPEEQIRSRMELKKLRRQQRKAHRKGRYTKKIDLDADPDAQAANSSHNSHGIAGKWRDKSRSDYDAELDMHDDEKESTTGHPTGASTSASSSINNNAPTAKTEDERKDVVMSEAGDDGGHAELDSDVLSASLAFNPQDHYQGWMEETLEEDELLLAKRAETARVVCHAPFKVLMFILQYLTRMNQAGALDAWITDALSGTAFVLQVQYFEWVLSTLLLPKNVTGRPPASASSSTSTRPATKGVAADGVVQLEEELLRLLALLITAPGIGHKPVKTARSIVEQALHHLQDHSMEDARPEYSQMTSESEYWKRVKAMLEGH